MAIFYMFATCTDVVLLGNKGEDLRTFSLKKIGGTIHQESTCMINVDPSTVLPNRSFILCMCSPHDEWLWSMTGGWGM